MRTSLALLLALAVAWLSRSNVAHAVPPTPTFASGYQIVWNQDFTTMSTLSVSAHGPCGPGGTTWMAHKPRGGDWFPFIDPAGAFNPFGLGGGYLTVRVQKNAATNNGFGGYTGGLLSSVDHNGQGFAQKFGYFEVSMQLPGGPNTWPAFWLMSQKWLTENATSLAEIDVMESTGNGDNGPGNVPPPNPNYDLLVYHRWTLDGSPSSSNSKTIDMSKAPYSTSLAGGFHTYGVDIEPSGINWYFDRQLVWSTPIYAEATEPMFVLLNLALGNGNYNNATGTGYDWDLTPSPSDLKVQYVAVWASPNSPNYVPTTAPAAPTGLSANGLDARVNLSWSPSGGASSYNLFRALTSGAQSPAQIANLTTTSFSDTTASNGVTYFYRVTAGNGFGSSGYSNEANATPSAGGGALYQDGFSRAGEINGSAPDVIASARSWTSTTGNGQFLANGSAFTLSTSSYPYNAAYLPVNGSSGVTLDGNADFTLSALVTPGSVGLSGISLNGAMGSYYNMYSNSLATLAVPNGFLAVFSFGSGGIDYNFGAPAATPALLSLKYDATGGTLTYSVGSTVVKTQTGVTKAQIAALRAVSIGNQEFGAGISGSTTSPRVDDFKLVLGGGGGGTTTPTTPPAPTSLAASAGDAQVSLSWAASSGATSYNVYRATSAGGQGTTPIATNVTTTSFVNTPLANGTTYYFRVAAVNTAGTSALSNEASATPTAPLPATPPAPTGLAATAGDAQVSLSWAASSGATSYNVYRATSAGGQGTTPIASSLTTTYLNTGLSNSTAYYYRVAAVNSSGTSALSNEASATPTGTTGGPTGTPYSDGFSRSGEIHGSTPDLTTNARTWTSTTGSGQFTANGSAFTVSTNSYPYNAAYLPVNGASGVTLDGSTSFTLSALVTPGSVGLAGISLNGVMGSYYSMYGNSLATLAVSASYLSAYSFGSGGTEYNFGPPAATPALLSLKYNAAAGTLTYAIGGTTLKTQAGVTPAQVAALRSVAIGNHDFGAGISGSATPPRIDDFKLVIGS